MCLYTNDKKPKRAGLFGIPCIKVVRKFKYQDQKIVYLPPYRSDSVIQYKLGKLVSMHDGWPDNETLNIICQSNTLLNGVSYDYINLHGLHTYRLDADWKYLCDQLYSLYPFNPVENVNRGGWGPLGIAALECRIPFGTLYYEGVSNCIFGQYDEHGYSSEFLKVIREIDITKYKA